MTTLARFGDVFIFGELFLRAGLVLILFLIAAVGFGLLLNFVLSAIVTPIDPCDKRKTIRSRHKE